MKIDWASLGLVALTTVGVAIAIVGLYSVGVLAMTSGERRGLSQPTSTARNLGYICFGLCAAIVLYGFYLLIPYLH